MKDMRKICVNSTAGNIATHNAIIDRTEVVNEIYNYEVTTEDGKPIGNMILVVSAERVYSDVTKTISTLRPFGTTSQFIPAPPAGPMLLNE